MTATKKRVTFNLLVNIALWVALFAGTHILVFQPLFLELDKAAQKVIEVGNLYKPASEGDSVAMARLEQLTHENAGIAYLILMNIERKHAVKAAGVDFNDPNANIGSIDVTKPQALLMQATRELSDLELLYVLNSESSVFDDMDRAKKLEIAKEQSVWARNQAEFETRTTLDQATKDKLVACRDKMAKKYDTLAISVLSLHAYGSCSGDEPKTSYASFSQDLKAFGNQFDAVEQQGNEWKREPSAN
jgi:hypothetical protein